MALLIAVACIGLGLTSTITGWHGEAAMPLLLVGILNAGMVLVMDGHRRY